MKRAQRFFIPLDHMHPSLPFNHTAICLLLSHYFDAPQWVWTLVIVWLVVLWVARVHDLVKAESRPIHGYGREEGE